MNFSLDYKNSDNDNVRKMLDRAQTVTVRNAKLRTLSSEDFLLHLCTHLYKEATTLPWIEMRRDMTFYKYSDIYMLINEMSDDEQEKLITAAKESNLEKELAYCINSINSFFKLSDGSLIRYATERDNHDLDYVIAPAQKKLYKYTEKDILKRFFCKDRKKLLTEVTI